MSAKQRKFKAEVQQLLDLVIHSLYSNRETFLRELISNASDAIDRARFEALSDQSVLEDDPDWKITLSVDREARTLTVSDNGIGMGADDIDACIGTIASSGTRRFLEELRERQGAVPPELIGQFGVGFYAAFMVADKVTVISRHAGDPATAVRWESEGAGSYTVEPTTRARRGTDVILHLKEEADEFLEPWRLQAIVRKFSDFVEHPVVMDVEREETPTDAEGKPIPDAKPEKKLVTETLNSRKALWQRPRTEVTPEEYQEFYRHISHDFMDPFETLHWSAEGTTEFRALIFIPQRPPLDMFMGDERHRGIQLYVRRIFITDRAEGVVPTYLRFLRGVVDSADLPLNVSREMLQEHRILRTIRSNVVKKVLDTLGDMMAKDRERYVTFWKAFGAVLKEGIHVDPENRAKIEDLALFASSKTGPTDLVSLAEYTARMPEAQKEIYYITAEDYAGADGAPQLEAFRSRGFEVLYLTDTVDEWVVQNLTSYKDKTLRSVAKGDVDLDTPEEKQQAEEGRKADEERFKALLDKAAAILGDKVKAVRLSRRLTESACCLVSDEFGIGLQLEKLLKAMHQEVPPARRILELNPKHPVVEAMRHLVDDSDAADRLRDYVEMLHDQALLTARLPVPDPLVFARRVSDLMAAQAGAAPTTATP
ncbi:MAG: molecular chaperone HtpG [Lentisphaerae bacterium]|nr:molecular chaperone HtpG [Lentisphaerota bacterium]